MSTIDSQAKDGEHNRLNTNALGPIERRHTRISGTARDVELYDETSSSDLDVLSGKSQGRQLRILCDCCVFSRLRANRLTNTRRQNKTAGPRREPTIQFLSITQNEREIMIQRQTTT